MKKQIIIMLVTGLLVVAGVAEAGDRSHRNGHRANHSYSSNRYYGYQPRHYRWYGYGHHNYGHHSSRHHLRDGLKFVAGALVLGSIIHAATDSRRDRVIVRSRPAPSIVSDYWYRIDNDGQCVEVQLNRQGQEVWTYVDSSNCY